MSAGPADAGAGLEGTHLPIWHGRVIDTVTDGKGFAREALQEIPMYGAFELVDDFRIGEVRLCVTIGATFEGHHGKPGVSELLRHDGAGPPHSHEDRVHFFSQGGHGLNLCGRTGLRAVTDTACPALQP